MAGVMQSAMVASPLIYLAAEDMTRGVNAILLGEEPAAWLYRPDDHIRCEDARRRRYCA